MIFRVREPFYYKRKPLARKFDWSKEPSEADTGRYMDFARLGATERLKLRLPNLMRNGSGNATELRSVRKVGQTPTRNVMVLLLDDHS